MEEAVGGSVPGREQGAEGGWEGGSGVGAMVREDGETRHGEADGAGNGDHVGWDGRNMEGMIAKATMERGNCGDDLQVGWKGVGVRGECLEVGEKMGLQGVREGGVSVDLCI